MYDNLLLLLHNLTKISTVNHQTIKAIFQLHVHVPYCYDILEKYE